MSDVLEPVLQADEIQGNVLGGFNKDHQALLAFTAESPDSLRRWVKAFAPRITWMREVVVWRRERMRRIGREGVEPADMTALWRNVAFTFRGLSKLTPETAAFTDTAFRNGLTRAVASRLGDPPDMQWVVGSPDTPPDVLVIAAGDSPVEVEQEFGAIRAEAESLGLKTVYAEIGHDLAFYDLGPDRHPSGREHFGFKDGVSQPGVRGRLSNEPNDFLVERTAANDSDNTSVEFGERGQPLICAGEFVLGYGRQNQNFPRQATSAVPLGSEPGAIAPGWARNGSFLVFRRLRQNVTLFNRFLQSEAARIAATPVCPGMTAKRLGALLVGRWTSGAPVLRSPTMDNPLLGATTPANNDFAYDAGHDPNDGFTPGNADAAGVICPAAAHIRKVNPRDLPTDQGIAPRTLLRRILRRGIPYGRPLPLGSTEDPDNADRGLLFLSYQSSIREQFEFTVRSWANDPAKPAQNGPPEGFGFDLILGQNPRSDRSRFLLLGPSRLPVNTGTAEWVRSTGGGYFFAPSRHALQNVLTVGD